MLYDGYYYLMRDEEPVILFKAKFEYGSYTYKDIKILSDKLPYMFRNSTRTTLVNLRMWLHSRVIQNNREFIESIRNSLGNLHTFELLVRCYGLSLNDTYWLKPKESEVTYAELNFYDNRFDEDLSCITLTGKSEHQPATLVSPECTTGGALAKCWSYTDTGIKLFKRNTIAEFSIHREVLSEAIAYIVAKHLNLNSVPYYIEPIHNQVCSSCRLFTSKKHSLLTISSYLSSLPKSEIHELSDLFSILSPVLDERMVSHFTEQFVLDWLIENEDRHLNNWGFLLDNESTQLVSTAPIYDNGRSLFWNKSISDLESLEGQRYVASKTMIDGISNEMLLRQFLQLYPVEKVHAQNLLLKANNLSNSDKFKTELSDTIYYYYELLSRYEYVDFSEVSYLVELFTQHILVQLQVNI